jgi:hypothetical protein
MQVPWNNKARRADKQQSGPTYSPSPSAPASGASLTKALAVGFSDVVQCHQLHTTATIVTASQHGGQRPFPARPF